MNLYQFAFCTFAGFAAIALIVYGICRLLENTWDWWKAIADDPMKDFYNAGLPDTKSHK
jgi:hypothetical protein